MASSGSASGSAPVIDEEAKRQELIQQINDAYLAKSEAETQVLELTQQLQGLTEAPAIEAQATSTASSSLLGRDRSRSPTVSVRSTASRRGHRGGRGGQGKRGRTSSAPPALASADAQYLAAASAKSAPARASPRARGQIILPPVPRYLAPDPDWVQLQRSSNFRAFFQAFEGYLALSGEAIQQLPTEALSSIFVGFAGAVNQAQTRHNSGNVRAQLDTLLNSLSNQPLSAQAEGDQSLPSERLAKRLLEVFPTLLSASQAPALDPGGTNLPQVDLSGRTAGPAAQQSRDPDRPKPSVSQKLLQVRSPFGSAPPSEPQAPPGSAGEADDSWGGIGQIEVSPLRTANRTSGLGRGSRSRSDRGATPAKPGETTTLPTVGTDQGKGAPRTKCT
jgi:hypothetical protein